MSEVTTAMFEAIYSEELARLMKESPNDDRVAKKAIDAACRKLRLIGRRRLVIVNTFVKKRGTMLFGAWVRPDSWQHWTDKNEDRHEANHRDFPPPGAA